VFPYLLRNLVIDRLNQVWAADITYIPIGRGFPVTIRSRGHRMPQHQQNAIAARKGRNERQRTPISKPSQVVLLIGSTSLDNNAT
jgi:hypothetical protein